MSVIWQLAIMHLDKKTQISGVVVRGSGEIKRQANFLRMIRSYMINPDSNQNIRILLGDKSADTTTDSQGGFEVIMDYTDAKDFSIFNTTTKERLTVIQSYPVELDFRKRSIHVVSDIDDTILVSHSPHVFHRVKTAILKGPKKRKAIPYTHQLLQDLEEQEAGIYYVSKSESNLYENLTTYIEENHLPVGKFYLTPFLRFHQLLTLKKDRDHKIRHIRFLLDNTNGQPFILIGDDGQRDMEIYTSVCKQYPERIKKIYIHRTRLKLNRKKQADWDRLVESGVDAEYFKSVKGKDKSMKSKAQGTGN